MTGSRPSGQVLNEQSPILRILYELVVPFWPLVCWVAFRTSEKHQLNPLHTFLDGLGGPDRDLFTWENIDESLIFQALGKAGRPPNWNKYMLEIIPKKWRQIREVTSSVDRDRVVHPGQRPRLGPEEMQMRLAAVFLKFFGSLTAAQNIFAPLVLPLDQFPFAFLAYITNPTYKKCSPLVDFESKEFWVSPKVMAWLSGHSEDFCHAVWRTPTTMSVLQRIQYILLVWTRTFLPQVCHFRRLFPLSLISASQNLATYTYSLILGQSDRDRSRYVVKTECE